MTDTPNFIDARIEWLRLRGLNTTLPYPTRDELAAFHDGFKAATSEATVVVPREPTHLMITAGRAWFPATDKEVQAEAQRIVVAAIYRAMLAAAQGEGKP